uniref:Uncharacterized protein n=1 Tax=Leptobrachium leishanense TaxID=445787 RepID=A0A8C5QWI0_9ANUR
MGKGKKTTPNTPASKTPAGPSCGTLDAFLLPPDPTDGDQACSKMAAAAVASSSPPVAPDEGTLQRLEALLHTLPTREDIHRLIATVQDTFKADLAEVRGEISDLETRLTVMEARTDTCTHVDNTEHSISTMRRRIDDLENRSRRHNIRVRGIRESVINVKARLVSIFNMLLGEEAVSTADIDRAHRALRAPQNPPAPPRDVICHLPNYQLKAAIMDKARTRRVWHFKDDELELYHDLSPYTLLARRSLRPVTALLREANMPYRWGHPFSLQVRIDNRLHSIFSPSDVPRFLEALRFPPTEVQNWEVDQPYMSPPLEGGRPQRPPRAARKSRDVLPDRCSSRTASAAGSDGAD